MYPHTIYIEDGAERFPLTQQVLARYPEAVVAPCASLDDLAVTPHACAYYKHALALSVYRGALLRPIGRPTKQRANILEYTIVPFYNCPLDCQYCYLQTYFKHPIPTLCVNQDALIEQVQILSSEKQRSTIIIHMGEFADPCVSCFQTGFFKTFTQVCDTLPNVFLEIRTKMAISPDAIPAYAHPEKYVFSWTLSPASIIAQYEKGTASLSARIASARDMQKKGFYIGLRLDPLIHIASWKQEYDALIRVLFTSLDSSLIKDCVLGTFRFSRQLQETIEKRFPASCLLADEFVPCSDGKTRYFKTIRKEMYAVLSEKIRAVYSSIPIDICMDDAVML